MYLNVTTAPEVQNITQLVSQEDISKFSPNDLLADIHICAAIIIFIIFLYFYVKIQHNSNPDID